MESEGHDGQGRVHGKAYSEHHQRREVPTMKVHKDAQDRNGKYLGSAVSAVWSRIDGVGMLSEMESDVELQHCLEHAPTKTDTKTPKTASWQTRTAKK